MTSQSQLADDIAALEATVNQNTQDIAGLKQQVASIGTGAQGPAGPAGPPGPQGPQGVPGPAGADGTSGSGSVTLTQAQIVAAIIAALGGASGGTSSGGGTGSGGTTTTDYFPADPGSAPFPSPENSAQMVLNGKISGAPYLRSQGGAVWTLLPDQTVTNEFGSGFAISVNGQVESVNAYTQLIVRQGAVYFTFNGGNIGVFEQPDGINTGVYRTSLPPAWTTTGTDASGQQTQLPAMPSGPTPFTAWTGNVILFGDNQTYKTMQDAHDAAQPGDTIQAGPEMVGKTVSQTLGTTKPIVLDLLGRITAGAGTETPTWQPGLLLDFTGIDLAGSAYQGTPTHQHGAIIPGADCIVRGVDCTAAGMASAGHDGTSAIRANADINLAVDHCHLWKNQNGIGPMKVGTGGTLVVTNSWLVDNYLPNDENPGSHNVYTEGVSATFGPGFTSIVNPSAGGGDKGGHAFKSRANVTMGIGPFYLYSGDASSLDIPDGSTQVCNIGAGTIAKKAGDLNHTVLGYGVESQLNGLAGVKLTGTTIDALCDSPLIGTTGPVTFDPTCVFTGNKPTGPAIVKGLPT